QLGLRCLGPGAQTSRNPVHHHLPGDSHLSLNLKGPGPLRHLGRQCMEAALDWIDERFDLTKLSTTIPAYYARWGFSAVPTHRFVAHRAGGGGPARPAILEDTPRIRALLSARSPTSDVYATREPGWLPIINLALQRRLPGGVLVVPQRDFLIVA